MDAKKKSLTCPAKAFWGSEPQTTDQTSVCVTGSRERKNTLNGWKVDAQFKVYSIREVVGLKLLRNAPVVRLKNSTQI